MADPYQSGLNVTGARSSNAACRVNGLIAQRGWILADGATGTNLFALGMEPGEAPELLNRQQPEMVTAVYDSAVAAGADLILTNSFGANRSRLKLHEADGQVAELNSLAAQLAHSCIEKRDAATIVAGSIGPTGELMEPVGTMTAECATELFHEQAAALKEGGADLGWIETMSDIAELECAAAGCLLAGLPYCATMSFDTSGRTMMGVSAADLARWAHETSNRPLAYGANCGAGAADLVRTLLELEPPGHGMHVIAKGNAGIPRWVDGAICHDGSPDLMADYAELALRAGAAIIGGCCGTTGLHLSRMRERLEEFAGAGRPEIEEIVSKLGQFSSLTPMSQDRRPARRQRRRTTR